MLIVRHPHQQKNVEGNDITFLGTNATILIHAGHTSHVFVWRHIVTILTS